MAESLCSRCFHSYVCEQFNEHRDSTAEYTRCHFYNDHFVDAADVEVVKHGRWIYKPYEKDEAIWLYHCSECNAVSASAWNYCRECGAKMDLEVTNRLDQH